MASDENKKSEAVKKQLRDSKGHFISTKPKATKTPQPVSTTDEVQEEPSQSSAYVQSFHTVQNAEAETKQSTKENEGNVIAQGKRRKAFPNALKFLLGMLGIILAFTFIVATGTKQILCDKGVQTQVGIIKVLQADDTIDNSLFGRVKEYGSNIQSQFKKEQAEIDKPEPQRVILFTPKNDVIHIVADKKIQLSDYERKRVFATGKFNACLQKLEVQSPQNIQPVE